MSNPKVNAVFWFRRDLRLYDNHGLYLALNTHTDVLPVFIFDHNILQDLEDPQDKRVQFIYQELLSLNRELSSSQTAIHIYFGDPLEILLKLKKEYQFSAIYANEDYEPYALKRDQSVKQALSIQNVQFLMFKDHMILGPGEVLKDNGSPYTIYTPYMKKWKETISKISIPHYPSELKLNHLVKLIPKKQANLSDIGFQEIDFSYPPKEVENLFIQQYSATRNYPYLEHGCSRLGIHLRFGTISIRKLYSQSLPWESTFLNELIWREFFIQILYFFPQVVHNCFKPAYEKISWRNDPKDFQAWCTGKTGYALVDAGMRELNETGYMHNRVRMVVASFLCKHLLIDWRWGEAYFAQKLLDYELASNNGNWQWAAGTGCDAAPYFRIFNPHEQLRKFDPQMKYVLKWAPEYGDIQLPPPLVEHAEARDRALKSYGLALKSN